MAQNETGVGVDTGIGVGVNPEGTDTGVGVNPENTKTGTETPSASTPSTNTTDKTTGTTTSTQTTPAQTQSFTGFTSQSLVDWLSKSEIVGLWKFFMSAVNYLMLIFLIFTAFANILRINIQVYAIKKILPSLIIGVILANFSLFIAKAIISFDTILVDFIQGLTISTNGGKSIAGALFNLIFGDIIGMKSLSNIWGGGWLATLFFTPGIGPGIGLLLIGFVFGLVIILGLAGFFFWLWFLLQLRGFIILFLVVIAPIAFISLGFPLTQKYFQMWWSQFTKWVFMAPAVLLILALTLIITNAGLGGKIGQIIFTIAGLYFAAQVPFKMGGYAMAAWGGIGKGIAGLVGRPIKGWAGAEYEARVKKPAMAAFAGTRLGKAITRGKISRELTGLEAERKIKQAETAVWHQKANELIKRKLRPGYKQSVSDKVIAQQMRNSYIERSSEWDLQDVAKIKEDLWGSPQKQADYVRFLNGDIDDADKAVKIGGLIRALQKKRQDYTQRGDAIDLMNEIDNEAAALYGGAQIQSIATFDLLAPATARPALAKDFLTDEAISFDDDLRDSINNSAGTDRLNLVKNNLNQAGFADANFTGINEALKKGEAADAVFAKFQPVITAAGITAPDVTRSENFKTAIKKIIDSIPAQEEISLETNLNLKAKEIEDMVAQIRLKPEINQSPIIEEIKDSVERIKSESPPPAEINRAVNLYQRVVPRAVDIERLKDPANIRELRGKMDSALRASELVKQNIPPQIINKTAKVILQRQWEVEKIKNTLDSTLSGKPPDSILKTLTDENAAETIDLKRKLQANIENIVKVSGTKTTLNPEDISKVQQKAFQHIKDNLSKTPDIKLLLKETSTQFSKKLLNEIDEVRTKREKTTKTPATTPPKI